MRLARKKARRIWLMFAQSVTFLVAALFVWGVFSSNPFSRTISMKVVENTVRNPDDVTSFRAAVDAVMPSVVSILSRVGSDPEGDTYTSSVDNIGSGVIVSPDGYILTNNHVIKGAREVEVELFDGTRYTGWVIGNDADTDLAVIKVDLDGLPVVAFGDDSQVGVGDVVIAFGNPFGLPRSVSMGVISAIGRSDLGLNQRENYFQTDAAINPGSSGGALTNTRGELIGINSALYTKTQNVYAQGIAFAIPASMAWRSFVGIVEERGVVAHGRIGLELERLPPDLTVGESSDPDGVVRVSRVHEGMPAQKAGVLVGDLLVSVNGRRASRLALPWALDGEFSMSKRPAALVIRRGGEEIALTVEVSPALAEEGNPAR